jgi:hypothetical protein
MMLEVTRVIYKNWDPDDEKFSELRMTTVKRRWMLELDEVYAFGVSSINKDYLEVWMFAGDSIFIDAQFEDFASEVMANRYRMDDEEEEQEEVLPEMPTPETQERKWYQRLLCIR